VIRTRQGAVRAPWRVLFFLAAVGAAFAVVQAIAYPLAAALLELAGLRVATYHVSLAAALLLAHWAALHWLDGRGWETVGLGRAAARPRRVAAGRAAGALAIGVPAGGLRPPGLLRAEPSPPGSWWSAALSLAAFLLPAALWEELLFRGYAFRALADGAGAWVALTVTSVLFGLVHLGNAGATAQSTALVTAAGYFLGAVLLRTRSLYAAWAAHWGWNWTMAALFHVAVSGTAFPTPDYRVVDAGPDWLTGGVWGPEGGLAAGVGMGGGMYLLLGARRTRRAGDVAAGDDTGHSDAARAPRRTIDA
jgi:membrane protease YdiL (CAAX protease family)